MCNVVINISIDISLESRLDSQHFINISLDILQRKMREHGHHYGHRGKVWFGSGEMGPRLGWRRGDFRFAVLEALSEKPMHGYALIQEMESIYHRPISAGIVYPTLQELQDMQLIASQEKGGKKVYTITVKGSKYIQENMAVVSRIREEKVHAVRIGQFDFLADLHEIHTAITMNAESIDERKSEKLREIISEAKKNVAAVLIG